MHPVQQQIPHRTAHQRHPHPLLGGLLQQRLGLGRNAGQLHQRRPAQAKGSIGAKRGSRILGPMPSNLTAIDTF